MSPDDDLPAVMCDSRVDTFWAEMCRKKTIVRAVRYPLPTRVMTMLSVIALATPTVNVCSQISMVRKIDTDSRSQLGNDTLCALLSCNVNTDDPCYAFVPYKDLCKAAKVATWNYVGEHQ